MAHFARIVDGIVEQVIVVNNSDLLDENGFEDEQTGRQFCNKLLGGEWVQTSYNGNFRRKYAGKGDTYDSVNDVFISPQPYPSWSLVDFDWQAPVDYPDDGGLYIWNEDNLTWEKSEW